MDMDKNGLIPKISVIIPIFNAEQYLRRCLDNILNQPSKDIEIICVDGGSTDASMAILKEYEKHDSRLTVIRQENLHAGIARNIGLKQAGGEYVHFLNPKILVEPDMNRIESDIYRQWYAIAKDKDADICKCQYKYYDNKAKLIKKKPYHGGYITVSSIKVSPKDVIYCGIEPWDRLYKRDFLLRNNILFDDLIIASDRYFYFSAIFKAERIVTVREWWITCNNNEESIESYLGNYDCFFKSFFSVWDIVKGCNEEIKQMILKVSIDEFLSLYQKAKGTVYEDPIKKKLYDFFIKWDMSDIIDKLNKNYVNDYFAILKGFDGTPVFNSVLKYYETKIAAEHRALQESEKNVKKQNSEYRQAVGKYNQIVNSKSYKLGCFLSFPYRKVKGGIKCYREHGATYTLKRCWQKFAGEKCASTSKSIERKYTSDNLSLSDEKRNPRIIVSLTSFPPRIKFVSKAIMTLLSQSYKPDKLLLWLALEEFPNKEEELPEDLLELKKYGLEICWCENLRSYKKLIPTLRLYPEDIIVTADDDIYFDREWLRCLVDDYEKNKEKGSYIYCHRITRFFKPDGEWHIIGASRSVYSIPTYLHAICSGAGTLFPPNSLHKDILNGKFLMSLAPTNDDMGIWFMAILAGRKIKPIEHGQSILHLIEDSQEKALWKDNNFNNFNLFWEDFNRLLEAYPKVGTLLDEEYKKMRQVELECNLYLNRYTGT